MSSTAHLEITFPSKVHISVIINTLLEAGWSADNDGIIMYLPVGDEDYDWITDSFSKELLSNIINQKIEAEENLGLTLIYLQDSCGGEFIISENGITISLSINLRRISISQIADVSWYLSKLVNPLLQANIPVSSYVFEYAR